MTEDVICSRWADFTPAHEILGTDFISPCDIEKMFGMKYTPAQQLVLTTCFPHRAFLEFLSKHGFALVALPPIKMNLMLLYLRWRESFQSDEPRHDSVNWEEFGSAKEGPRFGDADERFAYQDTVKAGHWMYIRSRLYPDSDSRKWKNQQKMVDAIERIPNVAEVVYTLLAFEKLHAIKLLDSAVVRTRSCDSSGFPVITGRAVDMFDGRSDNQRIGVHYRWPNKMKGVGILSVLKTPLSV